MCIVFYTASQPGYKLILASNRDEYLDRPALPAQWHTFDSAFASDDLPSRPWVLSGRDLGSPTAGTWLGITRDLRIGIVTNVRSPRTTPTSTTPSDPPSRGLLLKAFLSPPPAPSSLARPSAREYLEGCLPRASEYDGFNLLLFDLRPNCDGEKPVLSKIGYLSNRPAPTLTDIHPTSTESGLGVHQARCYGLSNTPLAAPWPKVTDGERRMSESLAQWREEGGADDALLERMMEILQQSIPLQSLGDATRCTCLQPLLIGKNPEIPLGDRSEGRWYGTRVSTVILVKDDDQVIFVERDVGELDGNGVAQKGTAERRFTFVGQGTRT